MTLSSKLRETKISNKLTWVFGLLVFLVVVVGGGSLYLAFSISNATKGVKEESDRIDIVDQIHYTFHHLTEAVERAGLGVDTLTEDQRKRYLEEIKDRLRQYRTLAGVKEHATTLLWDTVRALDANSENILAQINASPGNIPNREDLSELMNIELRIQSLAHWLSGIHRSRMEKLMSENKWKMPLMSQVYGVFVLLASFMILGASWFFARTIARPLGSLVQATQEIAEGNLDKKMAVTSKDEIGQLTQAFNVMVERLREQKEKLQGVATIEERERIARELHDTIAQDLVLMQMKIREAEMDLPPDADEPIRAALNELHEIATEAYEDVRQAIFGMRSMVSKGLGFIPALTEYLHEFSEVRKIAVNIKILTEEPIGISSQAEIQLIHIINEALTNIFKHSQTNKGMLVFDRDGQYVKVTVEDHGKGFDPSGAGNGFHMGLKAMRERAELVGGALTVESVPGRGTKVIALLPWKKDSHDKTDSAVVS